MVVLFDVGVVCFEFLVEVTVLLRKSCKSISGESHMPEFVCVITVLVTVLNLCWEVRGHSLIKLLLNLEIKFQLSI